MDAKKDTKHASTEIAGAAYSRYWLTQLNYDISFTSAISITVTVLDGLWCRTKLSNSPVLCQLSERVGRTISSDNVGVLYTPLSITSIYPVISELMMIR